MSWICIENLNYLHLDVADVKEQTLEHVFIEIFNFVFEAVIPEGHDVSGLIRDLSADGEASTPGVTVSSNQVPISNQALEIDFANQVTNVTNTRQQGEYLRIQRLFRKINETYANFNQKCLVHCAMGMSRSATSVLMFLMRIFSM